MRASSWNQIDSRLPWRASVAAIFLSFRGALFKGRCGGLIFLRVARSPLLPRQPHAFHHAAHVADVVADTVAILDQLADVLEREGGKAFLVDSGPASTAALILASCLASRRRGRPDRGRS